LVVWVVFGSGLPGGSPAVRAALVSSGPIPIDPWMDDLAAEETPEGNKSTLRDESKEEGRSPTAHIAEAPSHSVLDPDGMPPDNGRNGGGRGRHA